MCSGSQLWWKGVGGEDGGDPHEMFLNLNFN